MFPDDEETTVQGCKKIWQGLRTQYRDRMRDFKGSLKSGMGADEVAPPKWSYFKQLAFLQGAMANVETISPLPNDPDPLKTAIANDPNHDQNDLATTLPALDEEDDNENSLEMPSNDVLIPETSSIQSNKCNHLISPPVHSSNITPPSTMRIGSPIAFQKMHVNPFSPPPNIGWHPKAQGKRKMMPVKPSDPRGNEVFQATMTLLGKEDDDEAKFTTYLASLLRKLSKDDGKSTQISILNIVFERVP
ncbi:hypothetical protein TCAL_14452 [Tigriopus californicus]|uniref:MADF domain-containing protein n=1 Tax=Tigriopus californicus TaxID=6832 RepID=A0A553PTW7_TIGCA|nr:uncharacterized protein LOC131891522 [Tigriopus californicus]TRY81128.1 hypothetical protein TCAL_14452 [Tigriopus californicus]